MATAPTRSAFTYFEELGEALGRRIGAQRAAVPVPVAAAVTPRPVPAGRRKTSVKQGGPARTARGAAPELPVASTPAPGDAVRYRQGRGTFDAEVVRVDEVMQMVTLQRAGDGKRVVRPLDRVYTRA